MYKIEDSNMIFNRLIEKNDHLVIYTIYKDKDFALQQLI